jgi:hypothetical protein
MKEIQTDLLQGEVRKQLAAQTESWERFTGAVDLILKTT